MLCGNHGQAVRHSRGIGIPDLAHFARLALAAGAAGLTVHPRPDQRHITVDDVTLLTALIADQPSIEFNIEGNPFTSGPAAFMPLVARARPHQCTLVPDADNQVTSDHGWNLRADAERLAPIVATLKGQGARVSLFMDPDPAQFALVRELGADRVELYTKPARSLGLGVNIGHDLNLHNLPAFMASLPPVDEASIGHALTADALELGYVPAVKAYIRALQPA